MSLFNSRHSVSLRVSEAPFRTGQQASGGKPQSDTQCCTSQTARLHDPAIAVHRQPEGEPLSCASPRGRAIRSSPATRCSQSSEWSVGLPGPTGMRAPSASAAAYALQMRFSASNSTTLNTALSFVHRPTAHALLNAALLNLHTSSLVRSGIWIRAAPGQSSAPGIR
jgi:hypothetical protein